MDNYIQDTPKNLDHKKSARQDTNITNAILFFGFSDTCYKIAVFRRSNS